MLKNIGLTDRILRFFLGLILVLLGLILYENILKIIFIVIGMIIFIESFISYCYLYQLLGINTYKE